MKMKMKTAPKIVIALLLIGGIAVAVDKFMPKEKEQDTMQVNEQTPQVIEEDVKVADSAAVVNVIVEEESQPLDASANRGLNFLLKTGNE